MATFSLRQFGKLASDFYESVFGDGNGTVVTPHNALTFPPIWYAVSKISGNIGQLPLVLHREQGDRRDKAIDHPSYRLMKVRPNGWQTPMIFKRQLQTHALLWGNAYAYVVRRGNVVTDLYPLDPGSTAPCMHLGQKYFLHLTDKDDPLRQILNIEDRQVDGIPGGGRMVLSDSEVMHIPGLGFDGIAGSSVWRIASENWSIGIHADKRMRNGFENGFKSAMLLEAPAGVFRQEKDAKEFIDNFNSVHSGSRNPDKAGLLREGIKANVVSMSGADAQVIENRRYARQDAALWFLIESILGDDSSVSYNTLEQKNLAYLANCLGTWMVLWEQECNRKLLTERDQLTHYFKFHDRALLRTSHKESMESLARGISATIYSPNEARALLDMNPYEGGDVYANPAITVHDTDEPIDTTSDAAENAIRHRIAHMIGIESKRVATATTSKNYCDWLDKFYAGWQARIADAIVSICPEMSDGRADEIAAGHCEQSKEILLDAAGRATPDSLAAEVSECVASWDSRADGIVTLIREGV